MTSKVGRNITAITGKLLNEIKDEFTLIRHGLNQFKEHIDLKADIKAWKTLTKGVIFLGSFKYTCLLIR
jgi:hypothetical protein